MDERKIEEIVRESTDMHFHIGPDILPRKYSVDELIENERDNIKGVVLKSHSFPTIVLINAAQQQSDLRLVGSVTLNYFMGGFNTSAIYASAVMSPENPVVVWFPTIHAENHLLQNKSNYEIPPEWVRDPNFKPRTKNDLHAIKVTDWNGKLIRKCRYCLKEMEKMGCILATGHISSYEAKRLAEEALERNIKVMITHPMQRDIAMPLEDQLELADKGAYIEYCYIMYLDRDSPEDYPLSQQVENMKQIGKDKLIITSDGGQVRNPGPSKCMKDYIGLLSENGLPEDIIRAAVIDNPEKILK